MLELEHVLETPCPLHSPLLWSTAAWKPLEVVDPHVVCPATCVVLSHLQVGVPPVSAPVFAWGPTPGLLLQHHPEEDEVVQPHHVGRSPWVPPPHLADDHFLHLQACKMENSHRHLVEVVAEELEIALES